MTKAEIQQRIEDTVQHFNDGLINEREMLIKVYELKAMTATDE